jgi:hypothetical protein
MATERLDLGERASVQQQLETFPERQLPIGVLASGRQLVVSVMGGCALLRQLIRLGPQ